MPVGARAPFRTPSGIQGRKRVTKNSEKGYPNGDLFGTFAFLLATWGLNWRPRGQKERPEGTRGRSCGHRKNINFQVFFVGFWSFGPPGKARVRFTNRLGQPRVWFTRGTLGRLFGIFPRLNFEVDFRTVFPGVSRRFAARAGPAEGGEASLSELFEVL